MSNITKATFNITSANTTITLHNLIGMTSIDWGDGTTNTSLTHTYASTGTYECKITGATSIGEWAFYNCSNLTNISIPSSVTSIGGSAFSGCSGLTSITIPSSVTSIGNYAFEDCSSLTSITIPSSVTNIGNYALFDCTRLTSIYLLPTTIPDLGTDAFSNISSSAKFYTFASVLSSYKSDANWSAYASKMVADDIRLNFVMNAKAVKNYVENKLTAKVDKTTDGCIVLPNYSSVSATTPSGYKTFKCVNGVLTAID